VEEEAYRQEAEAVAVEAKRQQEADTERHRVELAEATRAAELVDAWRQVGSAGAASEHEARRQQAAANEKHRAEPVAA
jgi:hypothetical protein